jgi:hypothetical protein
VRGTVRANCDGDTASVSLNSCATVLQWDRARLRLHVVKLSAGAGRNRRLSLVSGTSKTPAANQPDASALASMSLSDTPVVLPRPTAPPNAPMLLSTRSLIVSDDLQNRKFSCDPNAARLLASFHLRLRQTRS